MEKGNLEEILVRKTIGPVKWQPVTTNNIEKGNLEEILVRKTIGPVKWQPVTTEKFGNWQHNNLNQLPDKFSGNFFIPIKDVIIC